MRKIFTLICAALLSVGMYAEKMNESFDAATLPDGWQVVTPDGYQKSWTVKEEKSDAHSAPYCAVAPEAKSDTTNETYLITPRLAPEKRCVKRVTKKDNKTTL